MAASEDHSLPPLVSYRLPWLDAAWGRVFDPSFGGLPLTAFDGTRHQLYTAAQAHGVTTLIRHGSPHPNALPACQLALPDMGGLTLDLLALLPSNGDEDARGTGGVLLLASGQDKDGTTNYLMRCAGRDTLAVEARVVVHAPAVHVCFVPCPWNASHVMLVGMGGGAGAYTWGAHVFTRDTLETVFSGRLRLAVDDANPDGPEVWNVAPGLSPREVLVQAYYDDLGNRFHVVTFPETMEEVARPDHTLAFVDVTVAEDDYLAVREFMKDTRTHIHHDESLRDGIFMTPDNPSMPVSCQWLRLLPPSANAPNDAAVGAGADTAPHWRLVTAGRLLESPTDIVLLMELWRGHYGVGAFRTREHLIHANVPMIRLHTNLRFVLSRDALRELWAPATHHLVPPGAFRRGVRAVLWLCAKAREVPPVGGGGGDGAGALSGTAALWWGELPPEVLELVIACWWRVCVEDREDRSSWYDEVEA